MMWSNDPMYRMARDMHTTEHDVINQILGDRAAEGGAIAALRSHKPELAVQLQAYYDSIFQPDAPSAAELSLADRAVVAVRVASHTGSAAVVDWYAALANAEGVDAETLSRVQDVQVSWTGDTRLGAAIQRADLITTNPAGAEASHLQELKASGFSPAAILSLSQVIAFVSYQLRLIAGLRALGEAS